MSNYWLDKYDLKTITAVKDLEYKGAKLGLTETEARILMALFQGPVLASNIGGLNSASVRISYIRGKLAMAGVPIAIRNTNGNIGRPGPRDPHVYGGSYYLAETGVDDYGRIYASDGTADRLQGNPGGTGREFPIYRIQRQ